MQQCLPNIRSSGPWPDWRHGNPSRYVRAWPRRIRTLADPLRGQRLWPAFPDPPRGNRLLYLSAHISPRRTQRLSTPAQTKRVPILRFDRSDLALFWQVPLIATWLALPSLFFSRFWRALKPDVVCCFGNNAQTADVIADCRRADIRTMLCIASDKDISLDYRPGNRAQNHYGMPKWKGYYSLANADRIVVQTEAQLETLRQHFGRDAALIRNPVYVSADDTQRWLPRPQRKFVLWIGRADDFNKRPMLFLELARDCPALQFVMIASRTDDAVFRALEQACPANLRILEHVPAPEVWDWLRHARVLVSTSKFEGFPNVFLQSAVMGVPIVAGSDPDGVLTRHGCGICAAGETDTMREAVVALCADDARAEALAATSHRYVLEQHEAQGRIAELEACIAKLAASPHPGRPLRVGTFTQIRMITGCDARRT